jgi:hypothetical protein
VITGFNTDIPYGGTTYHVQTEDKGLETPLILSLVYVGGAIIASKRTPYKDLLQSGFDEAALAERLQRQHKLICAAIKAGRIEDLKKMGDKDAGPSAAAEAPAEAPPPAPPAPPAEPAKPVPVEPVRAEPEPEPKREAPPEFEFIFTGPFDIIRPDPSVIKEAPPAREELPPPPPPVAPPPQRQPVAPVVPPTPAAGSEVEGEGELYLQLVDDEGDFRAGQLATIKIHVGRGQYGRQAVADASVSVRVLGTSFRPLILTTQTDIEGFAVVRALLPRFTSGRAAIIIRAVADGDVAEMRRIIHQA